MMKRKPLLLAIALIFIVGAALFGVNWRLNHPPLSDADDELRSLVAGADGVVVRQKKPVGFVARDAPTATLDAARTRRFVEMLRLTDINAQAATVSLAPLELSFMRGSQNLARLALYQTATTSELANLEKPYQTYRLHPRFEKPLRRLLDELLPTRTQPR